MYRKHIVSHSSNGSWLVTGNMGLLELWTGFKKNFLLLVGLPELSSFTT